MGTGKWVIAAVISSMLVAGGCALSQDRAAKEQGEEEQGEEEQGVEEQGVEEQGEEEQGGTPRWQAPKTEGEEIAAEVFKAHGGPRWDLVEELSFLFVVQGADERVFEARHRWDVLENVDHVIWEDDDGLWDVVVELDHKTAREGTLNGEELTGDERTRAGGAAYRRWVNDTYWLLMPLKMLDEGVVPMQEQAREIEDELMDVVLLSFQQVGLTPGDRYWVYVDQETRHVGGWEMLLESQEGEPTYVRWTEYQQVGPFYLPLMREWPDGERRIHFEDVAFRTNERE